MTRVLLFAIAATTALHPVSARAAQKGAHIALSCAFEADPFCNRLLAELKAAGHVVDQLPEGADLEAELAAPGAVIEVQQAPWEVLVKVRHDGLLETRSYKPDELEPNPAQTVAIQVVEGLRATFAVRVHEAEPAKKEPPPRAPLKPFAEPPAPEAPKEAEPEPQPQPPPKSLRLIPEEPSGSSALQLDLETYLATAGFQLLMNASVFGSVAFFVAVGAVLSSAIHWEAIAIGAVLAPIILALPSSHLAYSLARRDSQTKPAFSKGFLAASVASTVLVGGTMALLVPGIENSPGLLWSGVALYAASAFLIPAAEVLTLKYSALQVTAAPMALRGGGGLLLACVF